ncbi:helix-turn-helix transcriptional regulator [Microlunatus flavus]|uniref:Predicted transcriptional regulator, ArsR family n=1 Tax=Microlunatus flavus TaxID=1036181 RepID=A0A1H9H2H4_9ACTN|nr:metalloregulator ArsR/SmtB family transcription factor [Microlunatus flavus]SEQ56448.1 Predicted transcriptional regulator, ArsR family [Microlunatus flavus]
MKTAEETSGQVAGEQPAPDHAPTRQRVARSILEHGPSTAAELSERLGLTAAGVRRHLDGLAEQGLLTSREQRVYGARGRGRPARVFALTDAGRDSFGAGYDDLAVQALEFLARTAGPQAVDAFAEARFAALEEHFRRALDGADDAESPTQVLARTLSAEGYAASVRPAAAGEQLCQHHCPVAHVAERFPQLCEAETEAFSRQLGVHVQRLATIAHGDGVCTTHVPRIPPRSHGPTGTSGPEPGLNFTYAPDHEEHT